MRTFYRTLRILSVTTLFFFCWTFLPLWQAVAYASEKQKSEVRSQKSEGLQKTEPRTQTAGERFEKALEDIREHIGKAEEKSRQGKEPIDEINAIKSRKTEIESIDAELKAEFAVTEKKLKDAHLSSEILDRHHKFVKHYQDNLKELVANLTGIERAGTKAEIDATVKKAKDHLEKTKPPRRHKALDPNKLPHRMVKAKEKAPRLKKEQFEKDFPPQRSPRSPRTADLKEFYNSARSLPSNASIGGNPKSAIEQKPILVASNGSLAGLLSSSPKFNTQNLPFSAPSVNSVADAFIPQSAFRNSQFMVAQAAPANAPTADDLAETTEIQFTPDIQALATQLNHNPVKIYEWVRNNIEFVPTYGSIQGADMCLQTMQCNAFDTASLLIALLRSSHISAHYVYGTIEVPIDKAMNWVGGFSEPKAAVNFIASGDISIKPYVSGGIIKKVQMEHVWVETYIPYGNYRGAIMDQSIKTWIPMDGCFKQYTYTNGFDMTTTVSFSQDAYLSQVQTQNAVHYYQSQIQNYLDANMPDKSIVDVKGYRVITQEKYHFLPSTLPYVTVAKLGTFSSAPANMAATVTFTLSNPATGSAVLYSVATPGLAGKRLTVSYIPATSADEALIAKYGGFLYDVPAYMLNLKPVLRVEGVIKLTGEATTLGSEQTLTMQFTQPNGNNETRDKNLLAGAYYAIGLDLQGINENVLGKRNYQLNTSVLSQTAGTLGKDDLIGEHLFILATTYFLANDKIQKSGAKLFNVATARTISEGITSFTLSVSSLFGMPKSAMPSGINMDVAMAGVIVSARDGNTSQELAYMSMHGLVGSYYEHDIFEKIDGFSSVSAVKALQTAAASGIPIQHINAANINQVLPALQVSSAIITDVQNAVNAGKEVTISQANVQINDWNGAGYIIRDTITGAGAYMISGGLAGGDSTTQKDGMQIVQLHKEPLGWVKDRVDPQTRSTIVTAAALNIGEMTVANAATIMSVGPSYEDIGRCTGLVIQSYAAAGIDLMKLSKDAGFGNPYNVSALYLFVTSKPEFLVGTEGPLLGDIIFYKNTYARPAEMRSPGDGDVTHVGIVSSVLDGQVYSMTHAANEKRDVVDDIFARGMMQNTYWGPKFLSFGRPR
jgi:hypothetical protein